MCVCDGLSVTRLVFRRETNSLNINESRCTFDKITLIIFIAWVEYLHEIM